MSHPDEGLIHAWLDGELDATEATRVEALVASDPMWAAAAAEARGLIAAGARIVGSLDRVPANVIPMTATPLRRVTRRWAWRAAAVVALMAGSAIVLNRGAPELPVPKGAAVTEPRVEIAAPAAASAKSNLMKKDLFTAKSDTAHHAGVRDKDAAPQPAEPRANAGAYAAALGAVARGAAVAPVTSPAASPAAQATRAANAPAAMDRAQEQKTTRTPLSCFEQRAPRIAGDSAARIIRLAASALDDSIRLEKLTLRGDTLAAVNGPLIAVLVRCPPQ
jgi:hypothetical protein